jgi:hypothetical protein
MVLLVKAISLLKAPPLNFTTKQHTNGSSAWESPTFLLISILIMLASLAKSASRYELLVFSRTRLVHSPWISPTDMFRNTYSFNPSRSQ